MILLVEDQALLAMFTRGALEEAGYEVLLATTGEQALEAFDRGLTPSVLLTDIRLGKGLDRWQLAHEARARDPGLRVIYRAAIRTRSRPSAPFPGA